MIRLFESEKILEKLMKVTKQLIENLVLKALEAKLNEAVEMPVIAGGGEDLTDSDLRFVIQHFTDQLKKMDQELQDLQNTVPSQLNRLDQNLEDVTDLSLEHRDKILFIKSILKKMTQLIKNK